MKKIFIGAIALVIFSGTGIVHAQSVDPQTTMNTLLQQVIGLLTNEVQQLESQLAVMESQQYVPSVTNQQIQTVNQQIQSVPVVQPEQDQDLGSGDPVAPFIANNILVEDGNTSSSITFHIDTTRDGNQWNNGNMNFVPSTFTDLVITVHCDTTNYPSCDTEPQTFDATNNTSSDNAITVSGLSAATGYEFDMTATEDGLSVSRNNDFGLGTD